MDIPIITNPKPRWHQILGIKGLVALLFLSLAWIPFVLPEPTPDIAEDSVWLATVERGPLNRTVRGIGVLAPADMRWVSAATAGRVEQLRIKPGAVVEPDTVIAVLSNPALNRQRQQARWDLDAAEANFLAIKAQMEEQKLQQQMLVTEASMALESAQMLEKAQAPLAENHIISALDFEQTRQQVQQRRAFLEIRKQTQMRRSEVIAARLTAERARVRKFRNLLSHIEQQISELQITAETRGVLQEITVQEGQQLQTGSNIARLADPRSLIAELQVPEVMAKDIQRDLHVTVDTRNGLVAGRVDRIDPRVNNGSVQVDVHFEQELPKGARPDLSVSGEILIENINETLFVTRPAGSGEHALAQLYVLDTASDRLNLRAVNLGRASVSHIEILTGADVGDILVVSDTSEFNQHPVVQLSR